MKNKAQLDGMPVWFDGKSINEALFCEEFLQTHKIIFTNGAFFTPEGRVTDELPLRGEIFEELKCCAVSNIPRKISNIVELMKLAALAEDFPPEPDRIHLSNGTLFLDGTFAEGKPKIVRNRFPVAYNPNAPKPVLWLQFLDGLLYPEDIPTLQEYIGYCLIPSNKGQRMMVIKGSGGEGKSQIGAVLGTLFGSNMKDGSIGKISENRFARADLEHMFTGRRLIVSADELTSRVSTTELNETLDKLEKIEYSKENVAAKRYASNVLLATNMISVGIDVARLNVMLMVGQPKLTSEYIQASSRVGRSFPGVVFVQYDATKSRDRSHYERFRSYHESFYRFVEPTGATPFSRPARERALHAVLVSMIRQMAGMREDKDAINFDEEYFAETIKEIEAFVTERVTGINDRSEGQAKDDIDEIRREIKEFFDFWQSDVNECNEANPSIPLYFGRRFMVNPPVEDTHRLLKPYGSTGKDNAIATLTSMRNVDTPVLGSIVIWGDNNV